MTKNFAQVRLSRPTNQLKNLLSFYRDGLGLDLLLEFENDPAGYSGIVLGIPGSDYHLEFCSHKDGFQESMVKSPSSDHLLVLYIDDKPNWQDRVDRIISMGCQPVASKNPHWDQDGITFQDPDGWHVVLMYRCNIA